MNGAIAFLYFLSTTIILNLTILHQININLFLRNKTLLTTSDITTEHRSKGYFKDPPTIMSDTFRESLFLRPNY